MKILFLLLILSPFAMNAQDTPTILKVEPIKGKDVSYTANLKDGVFIDDLSWAWSSQNACFPATQQSKFTGKHVFFTGIIPHHSEITITVIPKNPTANFSVYAYQVGVDNMPLVPDLPSCISCEADHKWDRKHRGKTQDHTRTIKYLTAITRPYRMIVGVTGADGLDEGEFTIVVSTK